MTALLNIFSGKEGDGFGGTEAARVMMLEAHCQQMAEALKTLSAENEELKAQLTLAGLVPSGNGGGSVHLDWMRVVSRTWQGRMKAIGERNCAQAAVDRLAAEVRRLQAQLRQQEQDFQLQISQLLMK